MKKKSHLKKWVFSLAIFPLSVVSVAQEGEIKPEGRENVRTIEEALDESEVQSALAVQTFRQKYVESELLLDPMKSGGKMPTEDLSPVILRGLATPEDPPQE